MREDRARFRDDIAPALLRKAQFEPRAAARPVPGGDFSDLLAYYSDGRRVGVVLKSAEKVKHTLALVHGVHHSSAGNAVLLLPRGAETSTVQCVPWLVPDVELWTYDAAGNVTRVETTRSHAFDQLKDEVVYSRLELGERRGWVEPLLDWATRHQDLADASRQSVRAWHVEGRSALRLSRTRRGLWVSAGVNYSKPRDGQEGPYEVELFGPMSASVLDAVTLRVAQVIADRKAGKDAENREHRLQAWLELRPEALGLAELPWREFPTWRNGRRAYIDFLGMDSARRLRVIETKRGVADDIVLQGLEYWVWAVRHAEDLASVVRSDPNLLPCIDFVILVAGENSRPMNEYSMSLLRRLAPEVTWRVHVVKEGDGGFVVESLDVGQFPSRPAARTRRRRAR